MGRTNFVKLVDRMKREFKAESNGVNHKLFTEKLLQQFTEAECKYVKQSEEEDEYGHVK